MFVTNVSLIIILKERKMEKEVKLLSIREYRQRVFDEIQNAEEWIKKICDGYEETIICSDHYPFGADSPICIWIKQNDHHKHYSLYSTDWDLFDIACLPEKTITMYDSTEVDAFDYVANKFLADRLWVGRGCSIFGVLVEEFSYMMDDGNYDEYLKDCKRECCDIENIRSLYHESDHSRIAHDDEYCGSIYLNLYLVARR